jgi:hypothetical protein
MGRPGGASAICPCDGKCLERRRQNPSARSFGPFLLRLHHLLRIARLRAAHPQFCNARLKEAVAAWQACLPVLAVLEKGWPTEWIDSVRRNAKISIICVRRSRNASAAEEGQIRRVRTPKRLRGPMLLARSFERVARARNAGEFVFGGGRGALGSTPTANSSFPLARWPAFVSSLIGHPFSQFSSQMNVSQP